MYFHVAHGFSCPPAYHAPSVSSYNSIDSALLLHSILSVSICPTYQLDCFVLTMRATSFHSVQDYPTACGYGVVAFQLTTSSPVRAMYPDWSFQDWKEEIPVQSRRWENFREGIISQHEHMEVRLDFVLSLVGNEWSPNWICIAGCIHTHVKFSNASVMCKMTNPSLG